MGSAIRYTLLRDIASIEKIRFYLILLFVAIFISDFHMYLL